MGEVKHAIQRTGSVVGVLGTVALIAIGLWFIWTSAIQPHTKWRVASTVQKAEQIVNNTYNPEKRSLIDWKIWVFRVTIL